MENKDYEFEANTYEFDEKGAKDITKEVIGSFAKKYVEAIAKVEQDAKCYRVTLNEGYEFYGRNTREATKWPNVMWYSRVGCECKAGTFDLDKECEKENLVFDGKHIPQFFVKKDAPKKEPKAKKESK